MPILWDKKKGVIVNNESSEILRMLNTEFNEFAQKPDLDFYPEHLRKSIEEVRGHHLPSCTSASASSVVMTWISSYTLDTASVLQQLWQPLRSTSLERQLVTL